MSGGYYNYASRWVADLATDLELDLEKYSAPHTDDNGDTVAPLPAEIMDGIRRAASAMRAAAVAAHDLEWFMSGDYSEETLLDCMRRWNLPAVPGETQSLAEAQAAAVAEHAHLYQKTIEREDGLM
jgi:hypothetical protein